MDWLSNHDQEGRVISEPKKTSSSTLIQTETRPIQAASSAPSNTEASVLPPGEMHLSGPCLQHHLDIAPTIQASVASAHLPVCVNPSPSLGYLEARQKHYGPTIVYGGELQQGDRYYSTDQDQEQRQIEQALDSLSFREMDLRANQIVDSHQETFEWIFRGSYSGAAARVKDQASTRFTEWLKGDDRLFWVSGKPGSGKSTLMKFLVHHPRIGKLLQMRDASKPALVLQSFFWLYGSEMQRTLKGCLCTLLHQLWEEQTDILERQILTDTSLAKKRYPSDWSISELKSTFFASLASSSRSVLVFLDGLDEVDKSNNFRELLGVIHEVCGITDTKVCISSRQEPHLENAFGGHPKLRLQDLTFEDMITTATERLTAELNDTDNSFAPLAVDKLAVEIATKAEGVFLWAFLAINSVTLGIQNCDDIEMLYRRLKRMPKEMTELFEQMWQRLTDKHGDSYDEKASLYLELGLSLPSDLLTFTLAAEEQVLQKCMVSDLSGAEIVQEVLRECSMMKRKIPTRTAGLLEIVEEEPGQQALLATDIPSYLAETPETPLIPTQCTCDRQVKYSCFPHNDSGAELHLLHRRTVQYVHRSVAEFLHTRAKSSLGLTRDARLTVLACWRFACASLMKFCLGCHCGKFVENGLLSILVAAIRQLGEAHAASLFLRMQLTTANSCLRTCREIVCPYGWSYEVFYRHLQSELPGVHGGTVSIFLDIPGLMASVGSLSFLQIYCKDTSRPWSPYYKGYLLVCAARGIREWSANVTSFDYARRAETITWLLSTGADPFTYQLCPFERQSGIYTPRRPIVESWFFVLQMLNDHGHNMQYLLAICRTLIRHLCQYSAGSCEEIVWSIETQDRHCDLNRRSHFFRSDDMFAFVVKTDLQKITSYALEVLRFVELHGRIKE